MHEAYCVQFRQVVVDVAIFLYFLIEELCYLLL